MSGSSDGITRRGLLAGIAGGAAAAAIGPRLSFAAAGRARVIRVESDKVWSGDARDPRVVAAMIDAGVMALAGAATPAAAWRRFVKPGMRVGLKINLLGRPLVYTAPEVTDAVAGGVISAGVKPGDVIVWDRWRDHFGPTRYKFGKGRHGESIEAGGRYDAARMLKGSKGTAPVDTIAADRTDATISLPVLKDHGTSGVTLALKNVAFGCYSHYRSAHDNNCDPFIAEAYGHFVTLTRVPLIVLDATEACFDGGPRPADRGRLWRANAVYVASDPVALDVVGRKVIMAKRAEKRLSDTTRQSRHIETAIGKKL
ncbi:MAG TPA: DUF362 domain-containing protein, partial [Thermoanaerobaculaceae bacterium]|nr:DUF362 domain-containing protein [Thermoanaerobaculaceae bacterium]